MWTAGRLVCKWLGVSEPHSPEVKLVYYSSGPNRGVSGTMFNNIGWETQSKQLAAIGCPSFQITSHFCPAIGQFISVAAFFLLIFFVVLIIGMQGGLIILLHCYILISGLILDRHTKKRKIFTYCSLFLSTSNFCLTEKNKVMGLDQHIL